MSLLREIQTAAIESETNLASLLRKCKVLAAKLGSAEFGTWVDNELSGYDSDDNLPEYRIFGVHSKGNFAGPFGSSLKNADIPLMTIPEKQLRELVSHTYMRLSVASIERLIENSDRSSVQEPWHPDLVAFVSTQIYQDMNCMQAWKVIPITNLITILDEIRNRVLSFVLKIEAEDPEAGEAEINSNPVSQEKIQQIFHTHIAGVQNVSIGSHNFKQQATNTNANAELFSQLIDALKSIEDSELRENLISSAKEMRSTQGTEKFKDEYKKFMSMLADHIQVLGPVVNPYLPALAGILS